MYSPGHSRKKVLASDFDGTFFLNYNDMKKNIVGVEKFQKEGNLFVIATGRSYIGLNDYLMMQPVDCDYYIINHGATVLNKDEEVIARFVFNSKTVKKIITDLQASNSESPIIAHKDLKSGVDVKEKFISKLEKSFSSLEEAQKFNDIINQKYKNKAVSYLMPATNSIEIVSNKANKAFALSVIKKIEKVTKKDIYTIGDSINDIEMIRKYNGSCMLNAEENVKTNCSSMYKSVSDLIEKILNEVSKPDKSFVKLAFFGKI